MCGIVGFTDFEKDLRGEKPVLEAMTRTLAHRGPDASGFWLSTQAALGHRRLTVVDPEGGGQPMIREKGDRTFVMVYNGELYNTEDLRRELAARGYTFEGWSDTEVLLTAYMEWGERCPEKLNGIFAFAIWEEQAGRLFLARDRIGVKPLFYAQRNGCLLFASELKALFQHPLVTPRVDREGLAELFVMGPARTPGCGIFAGVSELRPGWCMTFDRSGLNARPYWRLDSHAHGQNFVDTARTVKELVFDAVSRQLVSDVPLCVLLSGGLDSSTIAAIASEVYRKQGKDAIETYSVDYIGNDKNFHVNEFQPNADAPWVTKVSEYLGTRHSECRIDTPELSCALFPAVLARDLPGMTDVDSSLLVFSRWIKQRATVGLSGECADEVFGGYPWFYRTPEPGQETFPWARHLSERTKLYSPELVDLISPEQHLARRYREALDEVPRWSGDSAENAKMRELFYLNLTRWMPTLLDRKDRMSMASGLELRVPFCDHRLVEYAWNIPWDMKKYRQREKGLLRLAMTGMLPDDVLWRKKSPYPKTHNPDYLETVRALTLHMLDDDGAPVLPLLNRQAVRELAQSVTSSTNLPWFGQLMNAPQLLAFLLQIDFWLREYKVSIA